MFIMYVSDTIKKLEFHLLVFFILPQIKIGHNQISVHKSVHWCWKQPLSIPASYRLPGKLKTNNTDWESNMND